MKYKIITSDRLLHLKQELGTKAGEQETKDNEKREI